MNRDTITDNHGIHGPEERFFVGDFVSQYGQRFPGIMENIFLNKSLSAIDFENCRLVSKAWREYFAKDTLIYQKLKPCGNVWLSGNRRIVVQTVSQQLLN